MVPARVPDLPCVKLRPADAGPSPGADPRLLRVMAGLFPGRPEEAPELQAERARLGHASASAARKALHHLEPFRNPLVHAQEVAPFRCTQIVHLAARIETILAAGHRASRSAGTSGGE